MRIDVDQVKARHRLSAIVERRVQLRKAGHELEGLCPFHNETTASFRVNDSKGLYHCFGCGAAGDMIDFIRETEGLNFRGAVEWLANGDLPPAEPIDRAADEQRERIERAEAGREAFRQWVGARRTAGTPAEVYLRSRGITGTMPSTVRFTYAPVRIDTATGKAGPRLPALIVACQDVRGKIVGVQRIFLDRDGNKARMTNPKLSLGKTRGCALRLGPVARHIILCEGPEDGLTLRQRLPDASIWVGLGTGGLALVELPAEIEEVTLAGDNNRPGRIAVEKGFAAYEQQGRKVASMFPAENFADWNDELLGRHIAD